MEFGSELDDDLFEIPRKKKESISLVYAAKICEPKWFLDVETPEDKDECLMYWKNQADYYYFNQKYDEAAKFYIKCVDLAESLPYSNIATKRDCIEGMARSLLHNGDSDSALECAFRLHKESSSSRQKCASWGLLAKIYHEKQQHQDELKALQNCIQIHPFNADLWISLSICYASLFGIQLKFKDSSSKATFSDDVTNSQTTSKKCSSNKDKSFIKCHTSDIKNSYDLGTQKQLQAENFEIPMNFSFNQNNIGSSNSNHYANFNPFQHMPYKSIKEVNNLEIGKASGSTPFNNVPKHNLVVCACLVRARLLLESLLGHRSIGRKKITHQQEKVNYYIEQLKVSEAFSSFAVQMLSQDIISGFQDSEDDMKDDKQDISSLDQFETCWLGWIFNF